MISDTPALYQSDPESEYAVQVEMSDSCEVVYDVLIADSSETLWWGEHGAPRRVEDDPVSDVEPEYAMAAAPSTNESDCQTLPAGVDD